MAFALRGTLSNQNVVGTGMQAGAGTWRTANAIAGAFSVTLSVAGMRSPVKVKEMNTTS